MKEKFLFLKAKQTIILVLLLPLLSSCYSYKSMTRRQPLTQSFLSKLEPGRDYKFELKTGQKYKIHIDSIMAETIIGCIHQKDAEGKVKKTRYSSTFRDVENYVAEISIRKSDPIKITSLIALSALSMFIVNNPPLLLD